MVAYQVGTAIYEHYQFLSATDETPVTGLELADLVGVSFLLNFATDKSALLTMTEIGTTGEYVIAFTPNAEGHYSLIFTEPVGTLGYHQKATYEVFLATAIPVLPVTALDDMVKSHIKDVGGVLLDTDRAEAIASAIIAVYSVFVPREINTPYVASDPAEKTSFVDVAGLANWLDGFSEILDIENPIGEAPSVMFDTDDYYMDSLGLQFVNPLIGSYNIVYTCLHSNDGSTLSELGKRQVSYLAAGFCLEKMAAYYTQHKNTKMGDATAEFRTRSDEAASRAREYMAMFYSFFGGNGRDIAVGVSPAFFRVKLDTGLLSAKPVITTPNRRLTH
jgi:hypothetical protein